MTCDPSVSTRPFGAKQLPSVVGDRKAWLIFFPDGIAETATGAFDAATQITALFAADRQRL